MQEKLDTIIEKMQELGIDTTHVMQIKRETEALNQPWSERIISRGQQHWHHIKGESKETHRLVELLSKGLNNLSPSEQSEVRTQMWDIAKLVPAGIIAATNAILPIPGTSIFTPLILYKAGLMPSRWKEAHILHELQAEEQNLRQQGQIDLVDQLQEIQKQIIREAEQCEQLQTDILHHWDENSNGLWDDDELLAYQQECSTTYHLIQTVGTDRHWYIQQEGLVFGPTVVTNIPMDDPILWIRYCLTNSKRTKWVRIIDVEPQNLDT